MKNIFFALFTFIIIFMDAGIDSQEKFLTYIHLQGIRCGINTFVHLADAHRGDAEKIKVLTTAAYQEADQFLREFSEELSKLEENKTSSSQIIYYRNRCLYWGACKDSLEISYNNYIKKHTESLRYSTLA